MSKEAAGSVTEAAERSDMHGGVARAFARAQEGINHSLQELKISMEATVQATCTMSCGTNDRAWNDRKYLESALKILLELTEMSEDEVVTIEKWWRWKEELEEEKVEVFE